MMISFLKLSKPVPVSTHCTKVMKKNQSQYRTVFFFPYPRALVTAKLEDNRKMGDFDFIEWYLN